ncbi:cysteine desulfurase family protein [Paenibacillus yanchengensis]|uniref:Cysteine desulfurase family protein n=1 Tax=Paenibacillus yanchengensis TaxID=2035833 RepID=A0ABW4YKV7_9BACL
MLYFDHAASTPPYESVIETQYEVMKQHYANPSSLHQSGVAAQKLLERARAAIAAQMRTTSGQWIFTASATLANNAAILGVAKQYRQRGNHIITTNIEHPSVFEVMQQLEKEGFNITYLPVNEAGHITAEQVNGAITKQTILVSIMHINNEIGTIQPIEEIANLLQQYPQVIFHVDAVQSIGKIDSSPEQMAIDLLTASAHKFGGPRGVGLLYKASHIQLSPIVYGGGQELGVVPGTENVPAIVATAKAMRLTLENQENKSSYKQKLRDQLRAGIMQMKELHLNGELPLAPHIVHFSYPGMKPEVVIHMLEQQGYLVATRSACSSKENTPSRIIQALGRSFESATSGIRISIGDEHTEQDIEQLLHALQQIIQELSHLERG